MAKNRTGSVISSVDVPSLKGILSRVCVKSERLVAGLVECVALKEI